ncbi:MAG: thioredoxin-disulfide reductase [Eubacterium sp.]|nr:thioredoxin-disulfide reductase [Eubacterium sp.]
MYDIMIIGAGPAGMSAAIYGLRAGRSVVIFEEKTYGGQIVNTPEIENYPGIAKVSGFEFATNLFNQVKDLGAEVVYEKAEKIEKVDQVWKVQTGKKEYEGKTVILATGLKRRTLGLEREEAMIGAGVSYCATCDGMFFRNRNVVVVGGGNTALEDAIFLSNYCAKVYLVHRRDSFRGEQKLSSILQEKENVELVLDSVPVEIQGEPMVTGLKVKNVKTEEERVLEVSGIFVAVGQIPENENFKEEVELDDYGYVVATEACTTSQDGLFTAGDCRTKAVRQLTTAAADGAVAALAASKYIEENEN